MLSLFGVSAWIEVDGKELEQYGIEENLDRNEVACWIASQADKNFSVVFRDDAMGREHSLGSFLKLDGTSVSGKVLRPPTSIGNFPNFMPENRTVVQIGQALSATSTRPFIFSKLELTDEDEYLNRASTHLGEIRIDILRVRCLESGIFQTESSTPDHGKVHERSKKAVSHCVSYGEEVKTEVKHSCRVSYLDGDVPLATFIFKYRDLGLLQANGIIPKPPPAKKRVVLPEELLDLTTDDDVKPVPVNNAAGSMQKRAAVKRSNPGRKNDAQPVKRIKREKKPASTVEVIDLT